MENGAGLVFLMRKTYSRSPAEGNAKNEALAEVAIDPPPRDSGMFSILNHSSSALAEKS
jgi:hypothetical protein